MSEKPFFGIQSGKSYAPKKIFSVPLLDWFKDVSFSERLKEFENDLPMFGHKIIRNISKVNPKEDKQLGNFIWMLFILNKAMK